MQYSLVSICGLFVTLVINFDVLFRPHYKPSERKVVHAYRFFLFAAIAFFFFDALWGFLDGLEDKTYVTIDTAFYFFAECTFLLAWSIFVSAYLSLRK